MTVVGGKVQIVESLHTRLLSPAATGNSGALCGLKVEQSEVVVAAVGQLDKEGKKNELHLLNELLPCGVEPLGVFMCSDEVNIGEELVLLKQLPPPVQDDTQQILIRKQDGALKSFRFTQGKLVECPLEVITEKELQDKTVTIRVRGALDMTCGFTKDEIALASKHLIEKVTCPYGTYVMEGGKVIILHKFMEKALGTGWTSTTGYQEEEEDCQIVGDLAENSCVEDLWQLTQEEEEDDGYGAKPKKEKKVERRNRLEFNIVWNLTNPACTRRTIGCAPIIYYKHGDAKTISIPINIDALGLVDKQMQAKEMMHVLKGCVARQVGDLAASILSEFSHKQDVSLPQVYHYKALDLPHFITIIYPAAADTSTFQAFRMSMHNSFMLPSDRPLFRKTNAYQWQSPNTKDKLLNVHSTITDKHSVAGGVVACVKGVYAYHHYMQDNFDDDGWGCAYRSLQTLISWFRHQGYTATDVPGHKEIQKCLIDIGDKPAKFLGSKQWIGSTEVGFVLESACSIQSKFISVSSGAQLASKAPDLIAHFESEGTPVMIGGGVYAHTILGVAWDEPTETCSWLVLDPHYTGSDDLKTILAKGWCGWKTAKFWNQTAFYNMCLPQRPKNEI